ncbi:hypothetical protein SAMN04488024_101599 [Pedobacter soli]|uniref:Uncharacterized protein n=1 Tax=Pedobacter soli TaxID=390242 RepID=A0A1G6JYW3_9SPHI|nr:hypothetical protein SAMN04488024_101599 [Pedobacter soli]
MVRLLITSALKLSSIIKDTTRFIFTEKVMIQSLRSHIELYLLMDKLN